MMDQSFQIAIAANFFALELRDALTPYLESIDIPHQLTFIPYNSLIEQLLRGDGELNGTTCVVILIQLERLVTDGAPISSKDDHTLQALRTVAGRSNRPPLILIICPHSGHLRGNAELARVEEAFLKELADQVRVDALSTDAFLSYHPLANYEDYFDCATSFSTETPYSQLCYAMLASVVARQVYRRFREPRKVVVVDCDGTLWSGNCGEVGPLGVVVSDGHRALQELLARQSRDGQLICLCSRNNEDDVLAVFDQHPDMLLKREHLTSYRVNWGAKARNLHSLAEELHLDLSSFIFMDDDPFQCEAVRKVIPEVLVVLIPLYDEAIKTTLQKIWDLDPRVNSTEEDCKRWLYYQQNAAREEARQASLTLEEFHASLDLKVTIASLQSVDLARAEQLMRRVNQFNLNGIRYSRAELERFAADRKYRCFSTSVADRFGNYGLVGVIIYEIMAGQLMVKSLLLSCRALGKGVERYLAEHIINEAASCAVQSVQFEFHDISRNRPMRAFLNEFERANANEGATFLIDFG